MAQQKTGKGMKGRETQGSRTWFRRIRVRGAKTKTGTEFNGRQMRDERCKTGLASFRVRAQRKQAEGGKEVKEGRTEVGERSGGVFAGGATKNRQGNERKRNTRNKRQDRVQEGPRPGRERTAKGKNGCARR